MARTKPTATLADHARTSCSKMGEVLQGALTRLAEAPPETAAEAKALVSLIVAYQKVLQSVLEFESDLDRQANGHGEAGARGALDLDEARREILGRLVALPPGD